MADVTLKQIKVVLQKELKPIKKKQQDHDKQFKFVTKKLVSYDNQFESISAKLDEHSVRLDSLTLDMIDVQKKTDILPDIYNIIKDNKGKTDELEERVERLESAA